MSGLRLFGAVGVELEYMIVHADTLDVFPVTDEVLRAVSGRYESEVALGELCWSNELVLHVVELKTNGPAASLEGLASLFARDTARIEGILAPLGGRLMPGGMHPWMDPDKETRLWPHEYSPVYEAFDRVFGCRGHGWANLQSMHLNLPFLGDEEFGRLHAAIRLLLPLLPALAASSPFCEGRATGSLDTRLAVYRNNARRIPSVSGRVVPEPVYTRADYEQRILNTIYAEIAPHDPAKTLQYEWLNARGAIARFERDTIEIRVLDTQECPQADLAVAAAVLAALRALVSERWMGLREQMRFEVDPLADLFLDIVREGERARVADSRYLAAFGLSAPAAAGEVWAHLVEQTEPAPEFRGPLEVIAREGPLARRLLEAAGPEPGRLRLQEVYARLCDCLRAGRMFRARP